jgi:hypothetical protein
MGLGQAGGHEPDFQRCLFVQKRKNHGMNLRVYGIIYGNNKTEFLPYFNGAKEKLWRFESNAIIDIVSNKNLEGVNYLGILSWKFYQKTHVSRERLFELFRASENAFADVYNLSPELGRNIAGLGCFMDWSAHKDGHGENLRFLIKDCCEHTGMTYENNPPVVIYANQFLAKVEIYRDYVETIVKPSLELLEGKHWEVANTPSGYQVGLELTQLKQLTGLDFYNFVPFVMERLFMQYVHNKKLKVISLI